ncbi:hypothetical protein [Paenibacillus sp. JJ-223]|uniref:hypothetical protein n=1 Tax=Paenibacillus sp. JJ-223 TaxID=2905647 RepID=UPI001F1BBC4A|nr:hypothetical protein [Paenibacillus sp. JJ-223]CAH1221753.1 hypothetical protein PAECIP111890_05280 [Paenibacillus sp. JJ-223]
MQLDEHSARNDYKNTRILELLRNQINNFYYDPRNQHKLSLLSIHPSTQARQIEENLLVLDELIISIERNLGCGNFKRALHFIWILQHQMNQTQTQLVNLDFLELINH